VIASPLGRLTPIGGVFQRVCTDSLKYRYGTPRHFIPLYALRVATPETAVSVVADRKVSGVCLTYYTLGCPMPYAPDPNPPHERAKKAGNQSKAAKVASVVESLANHYFLFTQVSHRVTLIIKFMVVV
jgi:hypothetical protein